MAGDNLPEAEMPDHPRKQVLNIDLESPAHVLELKDNMADFIYEDGFWEDWKGCGDINAKRGIAMSKSKNTDKSELSPFENKLIDRLKKSNERMQAVDDIEQLRPELTIRRVKLKLTPRAVSADDIKEARRVFGVSQAVFAMFLQVKRRSLQEWEQGRARKLLVVSPG